MHGSKPTSTVGSRTARQATNRLMTRTEHTVDPFLGHVAGLLDDLPFFMAPLLDESDPPTRYEECLRLWRQATRLDSFQAWAKARICAGLERASGARTDLHDRETIVQRFCT